jgi:hypothetical protein
MAKKSLARLSEESLPSHEAQTYPLARYYEGLPEGYHCCTLPCQTAEQLMLVNEMVERATNPLIDHATKVIQVRDIVIIDSETQDVKTGEIMPCKRMILLAPDGTSYNTPSEHARHSLARQLRTLALPPINRLPPYDPPLLIEVALTPSRDRSKNPWLHLIVKSNGDASIR